MRIKFASLAELRLLRIAADTERACKPYKLADGSYEIPASIDEALSVELDEALDRVREEEDKPLWQRFLGL